MAGRRRDLLPGLAVLFAIAASARWAGSFVPGMEPLVLAIAAGVVIANVHGTPSWAAPGVGTHKLLLETGIVLLGVRLTVGELARVGPVILGLAAVTVLFGFVFVETLARKSGIEEKTGSLLAAGAGVCGVSAVVAVAGGIDADEDGIAYAVATILLFDAATIVAVPVAGGVLELPARVFGVWAGLSMFSTGPVAAAGFTHSATAGEWATVTKLARNAFIGVAAVVYAVWYAGRESARTGDDSAPARGGRLRQVWAGLPKFLVGFLAVVAVANAGVLEAGDVARVRTVGDWLFLLAFAGLGFEIRATELRSAGVRPALVVLAYFLTISAASLVAVRALL